MWPLDLGDQGIATWVWIVIGFFVVLDLIVIIGLVMRRRRKPVKAKMLARNIQIK